MTCQRCDSDRIINAQAKCSDMFSASFGSEDYNGYVPDNIGVGSGDYMYLKYCADCGQIQGTWPLPSDLTLNEEEEDEEYD